MSSLLKVSRFPKHSERIVFLVFRGVPKMSIAHRLGKLMCCHTTKATKTHSDSTSNSVVGFFRHSN